MPWGQKVSPHHRGRRKTYVLVRTSTIFGADVHDPKGFRKTCTDKVYVDFLAAITGTIWRESPNANFRRFPFWRPFFGRFRRFLSRFPRSSFLLRASLSVCKWPFQSQSCANPHGVPRIESLKRRSGMPHVQVGRTLAGAGASCPRVSLCNVESLALQGACAIHAYVALKR